MIYWNILRDRLPEQRGDATRFADTSWSDCLYTHENTDNAATPSSPEVTYCMFASFSFPNHGTPQTSG